MSGEYSSEWSHPQTEVAQVLMLTQHSPQRVAPFLNLESIAATAATGFLEFAALYIFVLTCECVRLHVCVYVRMRASVLSHT